MEELIKRLERVIQTGVPDKDGMHPISAEAVLEVVKGLSEHGTNLAEVGTDAISKQSAIDELVKMLRDCFYADEEMLDAVETTLKELPPIQPADNLQKLADEIASFKQHVKSDNSDYLTGYLCALSVVEGMIAEKMEVYHE